VGVVEERTAHTSISRSTSLTTRTLNYSFTPKGSKQKVTKNGFYVSKEEYEKYPSGSKLPITYLPSEPSKNQPDESLRHMSAIAVPFVFLALATAVAIFFSKIVIKLQAKYNIKQPSMLFYGTLLGGFMISFVIAGVVMNLISYLISLLLT
jgi:hypothetical protein